VPPVDAQTSDAPNRISLPERSRGPVKAFLGRIVIALACVFVTALVVYLERDGYRDLDEKLKTPLDALYYATVTLSTTGYGDITPVSENARLTNILLVTPLRFLFLIVLVGTTIEVLTERSRQQFRYALWRRRVKKHTVVIGYGTKGRSAVAALRDQGHDVGKIVVVDTSGANIKVATADGCAGIIGDARREEVLRQAEVHQARKIIVATDRDDTSVLVTLTARRLAPDATIAAAAREEQNIAVLRQSGADVVIPTAESAGRLLGLSIQAPGAGEVIEDLLEPVAGLQILEREITPSEVGLTPARLTAQGEIVLTVIRNGVSHRFDSGGVRVFQRGDRVVLITSKESAHKGTNRVRTAPDLRHPQLSDVTRATRPSDDEWTE
jgi:voltage-gated potassium channel